ncbi:MAG: MCE family protein [Aeromicrobium sp.]
MKRLASLLALVVLCAGLSSCGGGNGVTVTAQFRDSAGLFVGNDVGVLGVHVGKVTRIDPQGPLVVVTLHIDPGVKIPAGAGAAIVSRSVATDRYVELTPVYDGGATMKGGTTIALAKTRNPVEFDQLLGSIDELTSSVAGPKRESSAFSDVISVLAATLKGNGSRIGQTVTDLNAALEAVDGGSGDAAAILTNLDTLTTALATNDKTVRAFSDNVTSATKMLNDEHVLLGQTFDALAAMLQKVAAFAHDHRTEIGGQLDNITSISRTLLKHQGELKETIETMPLLLQNVQRAVDSDGRLTFKVRPGDLVPGEVAAQALCNELRAGLCDAVDFKTIPLFGILKLLAGEQK